MMSTHERFEQLCALATTGDLSPDEFSQLREHLLQCTSCRAAYGDFHSIVEQGFPALERPKLPWSFPKIGLKKRFAARAAKEGISITGVRERTGARRILVTAAVGVFLAMLLGFGARWYRSALDREAAAASQIAALSEKIVNLERQLSAKPEAQPQLILPPAPIPIAPQETGEQNVELSRLQRDYDASLTSRAQLEDAVAALSRELSAVRGESVTSRAEVQRLERDLRDADLNFSRSREELERLRTSGAATTATIADLQRQLAAFTATLREQTQTIERDRELLARDKDIRDLMAARDLRIVDVQDDGTPGKVRPLPGRIFYTHGKSLIFYAYDLQNKGNPTNVAFQVGGKRDGRSQAPRSLGILYVDDSSQNRWALKFEDPDVLGQIDQVFVTVEPPGGSRQPTGKQLLTAAFLNQEPNHP
jgi:cell division protein FtsB